MEIRMHTYDIKDIYNQNKSDIDLELAKLENERQHTQDRQHRRAVNSAITKLQGKLLGMSWTLRHIQDNFSVAI